MIKFQKFIRKPLFVISVVLSTIFLLLTLLMLCIPHGKKYFYEYEIDGIKYEYEITLSDKFYVRHEFFEDGVAYDAGSLSKQDYEYEVFNGHLYILDDSTDEKQDLGKITSSKIILNYNVDKDLNNTILICKVNNILTKTFASLFCFSTILLIIAIFVKSKDFIEKKNKVSIENVEK